MEPFKPTAYLLGSRSIPSSITQYAFTGGARRWLAIPLDLSQPPVTYAAQALAYAQLQREIRFFGSTVGFWLSYTAGRAVRFDLQGNPVETRDSAYEPGDASVFMGKRDVTKILSVSPDA